MTSEQLSGKAVTIDSATQRTHELAAGFDRKVQEEKALTVTRIFVDRGKYLYLTATRKDRIELAEPVYVRLRWAEFLQLIGHSVLALCGIQP